MKLTRMQCGDLLDVSVETGLAAYYHGNREVAEPVGFWSRANKVLDAPGILVGEKVIWELWQSGDYYGTRCVHSGQFLLPAQEHIDQLGARVWRQVGPHLSEGFFTEDWSGLFTGNKLHYMEKLTRPGAVIHLRERKVLYPKMFDLLIWSNPFKLTGALYDLPYFCTAFLDVTLMNPLEQLLWLVENP